MRYKKRIIGLNDDELYKEHFEGRAVNFIHQYTTPILNHPTIDEVQSLNEINHIWTQGDRFYKLAHKYYNDSKLWWVIAWYNQKPTENHFQLGDIVYVPQPLSQVLKYYKLYY